MTGWLLQPGKTIPLQTYVSKICNPAGMPSLILTRNDLGLIRTQHGCFQMHFISVMHMKEKENKAKSQIYLSLSPSCRLQTQQSSASGWSLHPGWLSLCNTHRWGLMCKAGEGLQGWSHCKPPSQNPPLAHPSSVSPQTASLSCSHRCQWWYFFIFLIITTLGGIWEERSKYITQYCRGCRLYCRVS